MESHGEAGRIHIAPSTATLLEGTFLISPRGEIAVKGKGVMCTWWLEGQHYSDTVSVTSSPVGAEAPAVAAPACCRRSNTSLSCLLGSTEGMARSLTAPTWQPAVSPTDDHGTVTSESLVHDTDLNAPRPRLRRRQPACDSVSELCATGGSGSLDSTVAGSDQPFDLRLFK